MIDLHPYIRQEIATADPDGGTHQPTAADYERFEAWVIDAYGLDVWQAYNRVDTDGWARPFEPYEGSTGADELYDGEW